MSPASVSRGLRKLASGSSPNMALSRATMDSAQTMRLTHVLAVLDREASILEQGRPLGKSKTAAVTRIAKLLEIVVGSRPIARVRRDVVHEREHTARHQHSE